VVGEGDFPDRVTGRVLSLSPYAARPGRDTTNLTDEIARGTARPRRATSRRSISVGSTGLRPNVR
jgi:hypothetical protein